ncbi:MAG: ABC transporter permease subunit [Tissierellia bacterium]|nr:ABC transporter permease subunit [Tissierellia bacterium]
MNILIRELRVGVKPFVFWSIGLFFIVFAGMTKYTGFTGEAGVNEIFNAFPKVVLAVFGMVDLDPTTLGGFYAILVYYGIIISIIYSISLGSNAVNRESIDKTYEFIFTKPRSRAYIYNVKMISATIYISLFCILNYVFSIASIQTLKIDNTISTEILYFTVAMWIVSMLFCTSAALFSSIFVKPEKGILISNLMFLMTFLIGMSYDIFEKASYLRFFAPLKYFLPSEILSGKVNLLFILLCLTLTVVFYTTASKTFVKKDLLA